MALAAVLIAAYAAIVATASLVWQIARALREHKSVVRLRTTWKTERGIDGEKHYVVTQVINFGMYTIKVDAYGWYAEGETGPRMFHSPGGPLEVPPRDSITIELEREMLTDINLKEDRVVSWVRLTTGEEFRAEPIPSPVHRDVLPGATEVDT